METKRTGGLKEIRYPKGYKPREPTAQEKGEIAEAFKQGQERIKREEEEKQEKKAERKRKKRNKIIAIIIAIIFLLIVLYYSIR